MWRPWPFARTKPIELDRNVELGTAAALAAMDVALAQLRVALTDVENGVTFDDNHEERGRE